MSVHDIKTFVRQKNIHTYASIHICSYVCIYTTHKVILKSNDPLKAHTHAHAHVHAHPHTHAHTHAHTHTHTRARTHTRTRTRTHTHTLVHVYLSQI